MLLSFGKFVDTVLYFVVNHSTMILSKFYVLVVLFFGSLVFIVFFLFLTVYICLGGRVDTF